MKIKIGDKVYIQELDLYMFEKNKWDAIQDFFLYCDSSREGHGGNVKDFSIVISEPAVVEYVMDEPCIVDYDTYRTLSIDDIIEIADVVKSLGDLAIDDFNSLNEEEMYYSKHDYEQEITKIAYVYLQMIDVIKYRSGEFEMNFPDDYDPDGFRRFMS